MTKPGLPASRSGIVGKLLRLISTDRGSAFRRNTIHVLRANIVAQAVVLLSTPLLSRLYSPDDFGQFAFFSATVAIAVSVTTGRFDWSIPNSGSAAAAAALVRIGLLFLLGTSLAATVLVTILFVADAPLLLASGIGAAAFLVPVAMASLGIIELFNGWYVRRGNLEVVGYARITQGLSNAGLSLLGGLAKFGATGLIVSFIVSSWLSIAVFARGTTQIHRQLGRAGKARMAAMFRRFRREAALSTTVSLTNALSSSASIFMIATFFTLQEVGWYALMLRLALAPVGLISTAIGQSFWATAAGLARNRAYGELRTLYLRTTGRLCLLIVPITIGCAAAPFVIGPLFGPAEWTPAGYVLMAMAPHLIGTAVFSSTNHLVVYGRQSYQLAADTLAILLTVASIYVSAKLDLGIIVCTLGISLSMLTGYIVRFLLHLRANTDLGNAT